MIDIKLIRENPDSYKNAAKVKGYSVDIDELLNVDEQLRNTKRELQEIGRASCRERV